MDPLSQAVVGASFSGSCAGAKRYIKPAIIAGIAGGLLPDADILIRSAADPLLALEYHRHFTHSLAFVPIGGLVAALLCWPVLRRRSSFLLIYLFATLGYATHGILDSMTNYGTHLWWPFSHARESWSIISIIDPIFTLPLLVLCVMAYRKEARGYTLAAVAFAMLYWSFGYMQRERATEAMFALAESRGHVPERFVVKPSFANLMIWRVQYEYQQHYYIDAVRIVPFIPAKWYMGGSVRAFDMQRDLPSLPQNSQAYKDYRRFAFFSDGWLAAVDKEHTILADMRFATLPQSTRPLWGIILDLNNPQTHAQFISFRRNRTGGFDVLWAMMLGSDRLHYPEELLESSNPQE